MRYCSEFNVLNSTSNQSTILLAKNPEYHKRTKHIDVRHHFLREKVFEEETEIVYVPTEEQYQICSPKR